MVDVTHQNFTSEVIKSDLTVLVDFWAVWCGPCRMLAPVVEELSREYTGRLKFYRLDVDANPNTAGRFAIRSIPSLLFFKNGRLVNQIIGVCTKSKIISVVDEVLQS